MSTPSSGSKAFGTLAFAALAWAWLFFALLFLTDVSPGLAGVVLFFTWYGLAITWLALPLVGSLDSRAARHWWLTAGVAGCLGLVLAFTDIGLIARVAVCRPSLEAYAARVAPGTSDALHEPRWVGLFRVDGTKEEDGVVVLYTSHGFLDRYGLVFTPSGKEPPPGVRLGRRLIGPWHTFRWKF
jgi:hypothetical protein